jgi:DNA-binding response OmpR family regulator
MTARQDLGPVPLPPWAPPGGFSAVGVGRGILVADEDAAARAGLRAIVGADLDVVLCADGAEALWQAGRSAPAVVLLSASLPVVPAADVVAVLERHREGLATIVVGVGLGEAELVAPVVAAGANRVVSRPYQPRDIDRLLTDSLGSAEQRRHRHAVLTVGPLRIDGQAFEATAAGRPLGLTLREFELLGLLMARAGKVLRQEEIRSRLWEARGESITSNTIAVHVRRLRRHLAGAADIVAVRGMGYRLTVPATGPAGANPREEQAVSERDDRPADEESFDDGRERPMQDVEEGASPGSVGALDGAAAAGSTGAVGAPKPGSVMPQEAPDPAKGAD